jgi:hypothetical protein
MMHNSASLTLFVSSRLISLMISMIKIHWQPITSWQIILADLKQAPPSSLPFCYCFSLFRDKNAYKTIPIRNNVWMRSFIRRFAQYFIFSFPQNILELPNFVVFSSPALLSNYHSDWRRRRPMRKSGTLPQWVISFTWSLGRTERRLIRKFCSECNHFAVISYNMGILMCVFDGFLHVLANSWRIIHKVSDGMAETRGNNIAVIWLLVYCPWVIVTE